MKGNAVVMLTTLFACLFPAYSQGFWLDTHQRITNKAIEAANLNSAIDAQTGLTNTLGIPVTVAPLTKPLKEWIWFGSRQEDEPFSELRFLNHFYNPVNDSGLYGTFLSSYNWADDSRNEWRWYVARSAFYRALTAWSDNDRKIALANSFRALGQVSHLVQDTAVPAHVRNDGHNPDGFEQYVDLHVSPSNFLSFYFAKSEISVTPEAPRQFWDSNQYTGSNPDVTVNSNTIGLSEYSNANFISEDTKFSSFAYPRWADMQYYEEPAGTWGNFYKYRKYYRKIGGGEQIEHFVNAGRLTKYLDAYIVQQETTLGLDDQCYKDYAQKLLPRAVGYSSGLLNYFFRGKVFMEKDLQNAGKYIIKNESSEKMEGTFALYYDDVAENRKAVPGASWTFSGDKAIGPGGKSEPVTFIEPTSPAPKEKGKYILVFQGKLGMEEGAAVGRTIKLVTVEPKYSVSITAIDPPHLLSGYDWIQYSPWEYYLGVGNWTLRPEQMLTGIKDSVTLEITVTEATNTASLSKEIRLVIDPNINGWWGAKNGSGSLTEVFVRTDDDGKKRVVFTKGNERSGYDHDRYYRRNSLAPEWRGVFVKAGLAEYENVSSKILLRYRDPLTVSISYYRENKDPYNFIANWTWKESLATIDLPNDNYFMDIYYRTGVFKETVITFGDGSAMSEDCYVWSWCDMWFPPGTDH